MLHCCRCKWGARECSHDSFSSVVTEDGLCYTFNGRKLLHIDTITQNQSINSGVSRVGLRGVSKSHTFKGLVKVGVSKGVIRVYLKKIMAGVGVSGQPENPLDTPLIDQSMNSLYSGISHPKKNVAML